MLETHCICGEPLPCAHTAEPLNLELVSEYLDAYLHGYECADPNELIRVIASVQAEIKLDAYLPISRYGRL